MYILDHIRSGRERVESWMRGEKRKEINGIWQGCNNWGLLTCTREGSFILLYLTFDRSTAVTFNSDHYSEVDGPCSSPSRAIRSRLSLSTCTSGRARDLRLHREHTEQTARAFGVCVTMTAALCPCRFTLSHCQGLLLVDHGLLSLNAITRWLSLRLRLT